MEYFTTILSTWYMVTVTSALPIGLLLLCVLLAETQATQQCDKDDKQCRDKQKDTESGGDAGASTKTITKGIACLLKMLWMNECFCKRRKTTVIR